MAPRPRTERSSPKKRRCASVGPNVMRANSCFTVVGTASHAAVAASTCLPSSRAAVRSFPRAASCSRSSHGTAASRDRHRGSAEPPPASLETAVAWIEREHEDARGKERTAARELGKQVDAATAAWLAVPTTVKHEFARMTFGPTEAHLRFFGEDRSVRGRGAMGSAKLSRLAWASEEMAQAAGWNQPAQATTYLLLGVAAPMPHMSIATMVYRFGPSHGQPESLRRREATLTIRGSDFSYDELREIWRRLRRQGITEKKPLQQRHADAWKFVEKGRADGNTWQQVLDEWNADPSHHYYFWSASTVR